MLTKILSASHFGLEPNLIEVEVNVFKKGFPGFSIIGLSNKSIEEAKERVKTALQLDPLEIDEIAIKIGDNVVEIGTTLSIMGIKVIVVENGEKYLIV